MRLLSIAFVFGAAVMFAGPKETPPQGPAPKPFHLPTTEDFALPNGMKVTIVPYGIVPKVAVRAYVDAGGVDESASQVWLSKLDAMLMKEGTTSRSGEQVAREAAEMGGQIEVEAGPDSTSAGGVVLSEFGPKFIALLADVLAHAALPEKELLRLRADLLRQLAVSRTEPQALAREAFLKVMFPDHPYGRAFPTEEALKSYTIADARGFYRANFCAGRTHLYIAGKLDGDLRHAVEQAFGGWERGTPAPDVPAHPVKARSMTVIDRPGAAQSTVYMGLPVASPTSADYLTLEVMDSLLGGAFMSRITSNIREQKGYTYSPFSQVQARRNLAFWMEIADVTTNVTGPSLKEIFYEIDRIRKEAPPAAELEGIQNYLAGFFILRNTISPNAVIGQLHFVDSQGLDRSYLTNYVRKVMEVKPADIQRVSETYLVPSKMTIVVAGDKAKIAEQLKAYE